MGWFWDANIETARESKDGDKLSKPGYDGNRSYEESGTYGQKEYTVRERKDGTYDVYIASDSEKGHSHDRIDSKGNIIDKYHDYLTSRFLLISERDFERIDTLSSDACQQEVESILKNNSNNQILIRKLKLKGD